MVFFSVWNFNTSAFAEVFCKKIQGGRFLGAGNSNYVFDVHPYLGKMKPFLTVRIF